MQKRHDSAAAGVPIASATSHCVLASNSPKRAAAALASVKTCKFLDRTRRQTKIQVATATIWNQGRFTQRR